MREFISLKNLLLLFTEAMVVPACSSSNEDTNITPQVIETQDTTLASYLAPTYVDDYRSFSSWEQRSKWNLANVHDPTVVLADDGYYYMYQTDASFGNTHSGHGHFFCRRSKNLVEIGRAHV